MPSNDENNAGSSRQFSTEMYFQTQKRPAGLDEKAAAVDDFVTKWGKVTDKKVVLVTVSRGCQLVYSQLTLRAEERRCLWRLIRAFHLTTKHEQDELTLVFGSSITSQPVCLLWLR